MITDTHITWAADIAKVLARMLNEAANYTNRTGVIERRSLSILMT